MPVLVSPPGRSGPKALSRDETKSVSTGKRFPNFRTDAIEDSDQVEKTPKYL